MTVAIADFASFLPRDRTVLHAWNQKSWVRARIEYATDGKWFAMRPTDEPFRGEGPPEVSAKIIANLVALLRAATFSKIDFPPIEQTSCSTCSGSGVIAATDRKCGYCDETGLERCDCEFCQGHPCDQCKDESGKSRGRVHEDEDSCNRCRGLGRVSTPNSITVAGVLVGSEYMIPLREREAEVAVVEMESPDRAFPVVMLAFRVGDVTGLIAQRNR